MTSRPHSCCSLPWATFGSQAPIARGEEAGRQFLGAVRGWGSLQHAEERLEGHVLQGQGSRDSAG